MAGGKSIRQKVQRVRRRAFAVGPNVIHRFVETMTHQLGPHPVDERLGEPMIPAGRDPLGNFFASLAIFQTGVELLAGDKKHRLHQLAFLVRMVQVGHVMFQVPPARFVVLVFPAAIDRGNDERSLLAVILGTHRDARKEGGQLVKLLAPPAVGRVMMALGTLNLDAQEDARDLGCRVFRIGHLRHEDRRGPVLAHVAGRGDELLSNLVPMQIGVERVGQKLHQGWPDDQGPLLVASRHDDVAPIAGPVVAILLVG